VELARWNAPAGIANSGKNIEGKKIKRTIPDFPAINFPASSPAQ